MNQNHSILFTVAILKLVRQKNSLVTGFYCVQPIHPTFEAVAHTSEKPEANHRKVLKSHPTQDSLPWT